MNPNSPGSEVLAATLAYWHTCGIDVLSGEGFALGAEGSRQLVRWGQGDGESAQGARVGVREGRGIPAGGEGGRAPQARGRGERAGVGAEGGAQGRRPQTETPWEGERREGRGARRGGGNAPSPPLSAEVPARLAHSLPGLPPDSLGPLQPVAEAERPGVLAELAREVAGCQRCQLHASRRQAVFGVGSPNAPVVFVGEAPGADEDRLGEPFVGAAGRLLDRMLAAAGYQRQEIYIANVLKCRPPGNRNPQMAEVALCQRYLFRQIEVIAPRALFLMGKFAIESILGHTGAVGRVRGRVHQWRGIPVVATYHPAYYLRQPGQKRAAWQDLLLLLKTLEKGAE